MDKNQYVRSTPKGHIVSFSDTDLEVFIPSSISGIDPKKPLESYVDDSAQTVSAYLQSMAHSDGARVYRKATYGR